MSAQTLLQSDWLHFDLHLIWESTLSAQTLRKLDLLHLQSRYFRAQTLQRTDFVTLYSNLIGKLQIVAQKLWKPDLLRFHLHLICKSLGTVRSLPNAKSVLSPQTFRKADLFYFILDWFETYAFRPNASNARLASCQLKFKRKTMSFAPDASVSRFAWCPLKSDSTSITSCPDAVRTKFAACRCKADLHPPTSFWSDASEARSDIFQFKYGWKINTFGPNASSFALFTIKSHWTNSTFGPDASESRYTLFPFQSDRRIIASAIKSIQV